MAAAHRSDDQDVAEQGPAFEESLMRYLKRADRRSPLPDGFLERLQRDTPTYTGQNKASASSSDEASAVSSEPLSKLDALEQAVATSDVSLWQGAQLEGQVLQERYEIERRVAKGGMSWIYRATQLHLKTPVALKVLFPELVEEESFRKRFFDEARALSQLSHPHIVRVFDVFQERGLIGMALEWVEGEDLFSWCTRQKGPLALGQIHDIAAPLFDALSTIHAQGMIHRDLKPDNILLDLTGTQPKPKLADFGLVRAEQARSGARTHTGARLGTPLYMSPEQIKDSKQADERADLYSLGAILYELLLGRPPFIGDEQWLLVQQLHAKPTAPQLIWPDIPKPLADILMRSLEKDPKERFQSCDEFAAAFLPCLSTHSATTPRWQKPPEGTTEWSPGVVGERAAVTTEIPGSKRGHLWLGLVALILLLAGAIWAVFQGNRGSQRELPTRRASAPVDEALHRRQAPPVHRPAVRQPPTTSRPTLPVRRRPMHRRLPMARKRTHPVRRRAVGAKQQVIILYLSSEPNGAEVWRNGKLVGRTPLSIRGRNGQKIHLKLVRKGYVPTHARWYMNLKMKHKTITLRTTPRKRPPGASKTNAPASRKTLQDLHDNVW